MKKQIFTLSQVTSSITNTIRQRYTSPFWVRAELNKLNWYPHSGHAYPDLLEKKEGRVIAKIRSIIWKGNFDRIQENFIKHLGEGLKDNIEILFLARIEFNGVHGLSLMIEDIDVQFNLGSLEREKQAAIQSLQKEGVFYLNQKLAFPTLPQKVAIISVETSKGFSDFKRTLSQSATKYKFYYKLFPAILQGERAVLSIRYQLERIKKHLSYFDIVVITRGGGDEIGLSAFNHVDLSRDIATFPLPVLTGIGHAVNLSVVDMVAHFHAITPTQIAQFLIDRFRETENKLIKTSQNIIKISDLTLRNYESATFHRQKALQLIAQRNLINSKHQLQGAFEKLGKYSKSYLENNSGALIDIKTKFSKECVAVIKKRNAEKTQQFDTIKQRLKSHTQQIKNKLDYSIQSIRLMDPQNVLKRGYGIIRQEEKIISKSKDLKEENFILEFHDGKIHVEPQKIEKL
ncbi:MAG TPA: exodeoxyribonuclease VII large subunit [Chitinophagaceae bacterium]|nr:exodeoxyribonuclease VII large subunit [Chitinophagaceae bacterium]